MLGFHPVRLFFGAILLTGCLALMGGVSHGRLRRAHHLVHPRLRHRRHVDHRDSFSDGMTDTKAENDKQAKARAKDQAKS
jgi:hypothetical protein